MHRRATLRAVLVVVVLLAVIQVVPIGRANPPVTADVPTPPDVKSVLRRACYDCHSNETEWPWYAHAAPISWWLARHVRKGRAGLNFSTWDHYTTRQQQRKLEETWKEVDRGHMPPQSYLLVHRDARLSAHDRELLRQWLAAR